MSASDKKTLTWRKLSTGRWAEEGNNSSLNANDDWFSKLQEDDHLRIQCMERCNHKKGMKDVIPSLNKHCSTEEYVDYAESNNQHMKDLNMNSILERINAIESRESDLEKANIKLYSRLQKAESNISEHLNYITFLEQEVSRLDQYGRRENIEILGIPTRVTDKQLETEVLKILHKIGLVHLSHYSIVGCHRIGKKDRYGCKSTIVRFLQRKDANNCFNSSKFLYRCKELGYNYLSIVENLCHSYKLFLEDLKELKAKGRIAHYWYSNGSIKYKETDNEGEKPTKVYHDSELNKFFLDCNVT